MVMNQDTIQYRVKGTDGRSVEIAMFCERRSELDGMATWSLQCQQRSGEIFARSTRNFTVPAATDHLALLALAVDVLRGAGVDFSMVGPRPSASAPLGLDSNVVASSAHSALLRVDQVREGDEVIHRHQRRRIKSVKQISPRTSDLIFDDDQEPSHMHARSSTQVEVFRGNLT